jgi:hypothetical protein
MDNTATARGHHMAGTCHDTLALVDRLSLVTISSSHYWVLSIIFFTFFVNPILDPVD